MDEVVARATVQIDPDLSKFASELKSGLETAGLGQKVQPPVEPKMDAGAESTVEAQKEALAQPITIPVQLGLPDVGSLAALKAIQSTVSGIGGGGGGNTALGTVAGSQTQSPGLLSDLAALRTVTGGGGGGGGGGGSGLLRALGFGGAAGLWGFAGLGSIASLGGFGAEHLLATGLGLGGSAIGAGLGGGLLGLGAAGTAGVGIGTDLAGIGQAAGDIQKTNQAYQQLTTAVAQYGAASTQAQAAQFNMNQTLASFSPVAQGAVLAAVATVNAFKQQFDQATGAAEKTGAEIINQAITVGEKFLPTVGKYAAENMKIIQAGLQPLFGWLQGQGLAIFTELEQVFQSHLPTAIHAGVQAFELLVRTIGLVAPETGRIISVIDKFVTRMNGADWGIWATDVQKLIDLFRVWEAFIVVLVKDLADIFKLTAGLGSAIIVDLTDKLNHLHEILTQPGGNFWVNQLHGLFTGHKTEILELIDLVLNLGGGIAKMYLLAAPAILQVTNLLLVLANLLLELVNKFNIAGFALGPFILGTIILASRIAPLRDLFIGASKDAGAFGRAVDLLGLKIAGLLGGTGTKGGLLGGIFGKGAEDDAAASGLIGWAENAARGVKLAFTRQLGDLGKTIGNLFSAGGTTIVPGTGPITQEEGVFHKFFTNIQTWAKQAANGVKQAFKDVGSAISSGISTAVGGGGDFFGALFGKSKAAEGEAQTVGTRIGVAIRDGMKTGLSAVGAAFQGAIVVAQLAGNKIYEALIAPIGRAVARFAIGMGEIIASMIGVEDASVGLKLALVGITAVGILAVVAGIVLLVQHFGALRGLMIAGAAAVIGLAIAFAVLDAVPIVALIAAVGLAIVGLVAGIIELIHWFNSGSSAARTAGTVIWIAFNLAFAGIPALIKFVIDNFNSFINFFKNLPGEMLGIGKAIIEGLIHGLEDGAKDIGHIASDIGHTVLGAFKSVFSIFSPSGKTINIGLLVIQGLQVGIQQGIGGAANAASQAAQTVLNAFNKIGGADNAKTAIQGLSGVLNSLDQAFQNFANAANAAANISAPAIEAMKGGLVELKNVAPEITTAVNAINKALGGIHDPGGLLNFRHVLSDLGSAFVNFSRAASAASNITLKSLLQMAVGLGALKNFGPAIATEAGQMAKGFDSVANKVPNFGKSLAQVSGILSGIGSVFVNFSRAASAASNVTLLSVLQMGNALNLLSKSAPAIVGWSVSMVDSFQKATSQTPHLRAELSGVAGIMSAVGSVFVNFSRAAGAASNLSVFSLIQIGVALQNLAHGAPFFVTQLDSIKKSFDKLHGIGQLTTDLSNITKAFSNLTTLFSTLQQTASQAASVTPQAIQNIVKALGQIGGGLLGTLLALTLFENTWKQDWSLAWLQVQTFWTQTQSLFDSMKSSGLDSLKSAADSFKSTWSNDWNDAKSQVSQAVQGITTHIGDIQNQGLDKLKTAIDNLKTDWGNDWKTITSDVGGVWSSISGTFSNITNGLSGIDTAIGNLETNWGSAWSHMVGQIQSAGSQIANTASQIQSAVANAKNASVALPAPTVAPGHNALGGVIQPGSWSWVGEQGPELVWSGAHPVSVLPNDKVQGLLGSPYNAAALTGVGAGPVAQGTGNQVDYAPTIVIQGSGLSQSQLQNAVENALSRGFQTLARTIETHS